ncbi:two-component system, OmpR family, phosphate regulon sensor histidine kinase PhoR [Paenacidovorax caeni]|uniref:Phosphate regulon sensor protein PhoR n=1 Tax=Paenacidovorax caeni TaxID=343013 RepID=A0A1I7GDW1_9BURK|nr:phosphate regulon sensor histidine kinase PhoR [Paenacidovorax caeni]SFU46649.1 two-component system, OmpR family, phosphate regulon sensor histidine kinase PhoR [Paenacidovorax caeni]
MLWRFSFFFALQLAGGALGGWLAGAWCAALGIALASWAGFAWESWRGLRVIHWLREDGALARAPVLHGLWGEAVERMRRLLRQRQQEAQASDARLQEFLAALQASPNGVLLLDAEGHIEWCNQTAAQHLGLDAERDLMQSIGNLLREPAFNAYYAGGDFSHDLLLPGRESTPSHPVKLSVHLHPYGDGRKLMLSRDVTALEQAEAMRRDFVANVSHEIRTPLTVLVGFIETLQTLQLPNAERARYLSLMAQQGARMHSVVQDLLTLSRLEGSPLPGRGDWSSVRALLVRCEEEARALSQLLTPEGSMPHRLAFPEDAQLRAAGDIAGSVPELHSALSNLISNAVRYTPPGGQITVQWQPLEGGGARFSVRDTGPGIAPEHIPRLTERFYRVDRSRSRETGGTGLGLAIVKHVLQRHGAQLDISSVLGQGSEFAVTFPASRLRVPRAAQA